MTRTIFMLVAAAAVATCDRTAPRRPEKTVDDTNLPIPGAETKEAASVTAPPSQSPTGVAADRTPLAEPKGPIDPKSAEAAGQVVQHYGALIEQRRFVEAERRWGDVDLARHFAEGLKRYSEVHLEIGVPGEMEGAAGSIYVTEPVVFYGKLPGGAFRRPADVILRRVNDVPGSTEAKRRWHIERIDWTHAP